MTISVARYKDSSGHYQTITPSIPENTKAMEKTMSEWSERTSNWTWKEYTGVTAFTVFFVNTVILIICASNQCFENSDVTKTYCNGICTSEPVQITASVISGIITCGLFSKIICCK